MLIVLQFIYLFILLILIIFYLESENHPRFINKYLRIRHRTLPKNLLTSLN